MSTTQLTSENGQTQSLNVIAQMAQRFNMNPKAFEATMRATVFPAEASNEQFTAFLLVAKAYDLNPLLKQIYAYPDKRRGGVVPIVPIDGWLRIINTHPSFGGMAFKDHFDESGKITSITCVIYRNDRNHPIEVTEYIAECRMNTEPWQKWPVRMLRHKATIQAARYAFGFSGIYDDDEGIRIINGGAAENIIDQSPEKSDPWTPELLEVASIAADSGIDQYQKWWQKQPSDFRALAATTQVHTGFKAHAASLILPSVNGDNA